MKIAIVGAGIAGLTAAMALAKQGHTIQVFEQSGLKEKTGLGVGLQDFAVQALLDLGLSNLIAEGVLIKRTAFYTRTGQKIYQTASNKGKLGVRRSLLLSYLGEAVTNLIGEKGLYPQHQLISFQQHTTHVDILFKERVGNKLINVNADVLIGADGLHSSVRSILFPNTNDVNFSGIVTWRGLTHYPNFSQKEMILMGDRWAKTVIYPVKVLPNNQIEYYWAAEVRQCKGALSGMPQDTVGCFSEFAPQFDDFRFRTIKITDLYQKAHKILKFPIVDKDPIHRWFFNRSVLLGDAAHPMYPMGGNGASQAIIDATTLAHSMKVTTSPQEAFKLYALKRVKKVNAVVRHNRALGPDKILTLNPSDFGSDWYHNCQSIINTYKALTHPSVDQQDE